MMKIGIETRTTGVILKYNLEFSAHLLYSTGQASN